MSKKLEDYYIIKNGRKLRYGYTTGSCSAAAAKAAALILFTGKLCDRVQLATPKGIELDLAVEDITRAEDFVSCAIRKDGGDDPDATHGALVYARVSKSAAPGIHLDGGLGVGRVTRKGLEQNIGEAAINRVPRQMILREVENVCDQCDYEGGLDVIISIPAGVELAKKTFNPRLGIQGGISVLGTSGIVVPMSEEALMKSIEIEMNMRLADGNGYLLITPGNYGEDFVKVHMDVDFTRNMKCSNFVGETIDMAVNRDVKGILFVSHIGKFVKVAAGIMNTHSRNSDGRAEILAANAIRAGASAQTAGQILDTVTTDEALEILQKAGLLRETMDCILEKMDFYLNKRSCGQIPVGAVIFSNVFGYLGETKTAGEVKKYVR